MSGRLGSTDVGEMFSAPPARAAGLSGTLAPRPHLVRPAEQPSPKEDPEPAAAEAPSRSSAHSDRRPRKHTDPQSAAPAHGEPSPSRPLLIVYVTQSDLRWVTRRRKATDLTNAQIVLSAIETTSEQLADEFKVAPRAKSGLFATPTASSQRTGERHVQLGLSGILPDDRAVLDRLVAGTGAGSISALARAALRIVQRENA